MIRPFFVSVTLVLAISVLAVAPRAGAAGIEYPATVPGGHARDYFAAFNTGEEAMRAFWTAHGSKASLAQRPVELRLDVWHEMHDEHGAIKPLSVKASRDDFIQVVARTERSGDLLIGFMCEPEAPHGLVALRVEPADQEPSAGAAPPIRKELEAPDTSPLPTDAQIVAGLTAELESLVKSGSFSGAVVLDKSGKTLFEHAYGMASREAKIPNRLDTRFNLASINKIFTHLAIMQLAQQGKLGLDHTIDRYLKDYLSESAKKITIQMLLDHKAGVPDVLSHPDIWKRADSLRTAADWYAMGRDLPLRFEPGTQQAYSNGGFVLLGAIIEKASGEDYYEYMRAHIYGPAGMTSTDHYTAKEIGDGFAIGYMGRGRASRGAPGDDGRRPNLEQLPWRGSPAGGGYSTVGDLVRFAHAARAGKYFPAGKAPEMFGEKFGLGIAGGSEGVNGLFMASGPYTFVVLANLDPPAAERFGETTGRMLRRASGVASKGAPVKVGGK